MEAFIIGLAFLDFVPVTFMLLSQLYLIFKLWHKIRIYSLFLILACAFSIISGYLIATNKLLFAFGFIKFESPEVLHMISSFGILLTGIIVFLTFKNKKSQSATYLSIGMIAGFINLIGVLLLIISYFKVAIKNKNKILTVLCVVSTILTIILVVTNMSFNFNTSVVGHIIGEITNTTLQIFILFLTVKCYKYLP